MLCASKIIIFLLHTFCLHDMLLILAHPSDVAPWHYIELPRSWWSFSGEVHYQSNPIFDLWKTKGHQACTVGYNPNFEVSHFNCDEGHM